jgi:hypothetical protein
MARPSERKQAVYLRQILKRVTSFFFDVKGPQSYSLFLCGASASDPASIRTKVSHAIQSVRSKFNYQVYFPEFLFEELLRGHGADSLLDLENILADSVDSVVIIAESPGTIAELGAFANHDVLRKKLVVFIDAKYRSHRSFINLGPIRLLKKNHSNSVHFVDFSSPESVQEISEISRRFARDSRGVTLNKGSLENPILSLHPILAFISVAEPISKELVHEIASSEAMDQHKVEVSIKTALNFLNNRGLIRNYSNDLSITKQGRYYLNRAFSQKQTNYKLDRLLLEQRVHYLNKCLRRNACFSPHAQ